MQSSIMSRLLSLIEETRSEIKNQDRQIAQLFSCFETLQGQVSECERNIDYLSEFAYPLEDTTETYSQDED